VNAAPCGGGKVATVVSIAPHLWFDDDAAEAVAFYLSVFPDGEILNDVVFDAHNDGGDGRPGGDVQVIDFRVGGLTLSAFNGGPHHDFNDSISLAVTCETQADVNAVYEGLAGGGGQELQCGWVRDKFGVSWQVIPAALYELLGHPDPEKAKRAVGAMLGMKKIDVAEIESAMNRG
jgi:predicted 3-demethylubiquinone-9 3-methyltransferase (glyoxalase superfamily)